VAASPALSSVPNYNGDKCTVMTAMSRLPEGREALAQFVNQHPLVLRIVDRHDDEVNSAADKCGLRRRLQLAARTNPCFLHAIGVRLFDEVGVREGHAEIRKLIDRPLPADHPESAVFVTRTTGLSLSLTAVSCS
jgi:hypothetical protein